MEKIIKFLKDKRHEIIGGLIVWGGYLLFVNFF